MSVSTEDEKDPEKVGRASEVVSLRDGRECSARGSRKGWIGR